MIKLWKITLANYSFCQELFNLWEKPPFSKISFIYFLVSHGSLNYLSPLVTVVHIDNWLIAPGGCPHSVHVAYFPKYSMGISMINSLGYLNDTWWTGMNSWVLVIAAWRLILPEETPSTMMDRDELVSPGYSCLKADNTRGNSKYHDGQGWTRESWL